MGWISTLSRGRRVFRLVVALALAACGAGDNRVDPADLELRDLLGIAPNAALRWDDDQRASARGVLDDGLCAHADRRVELALATGTTLDERIARTLARNDADRSDSGDPALGLLRIDLAGTRVTLIPSPPWTRGGLSAL